jgi:hypothetical protein
MVMSVTPEGLIISSNADGSYAGRPVTRVLQAMQQAAEAAEAAMQLARETAMQLARETAIQADAHRQAELQEAAAQYWWTVGCLGCLTLALVTVGVAAILLYRRRPVRTVIRVVPVGNDTMASRKQSRAAIDALRPRPTELTKEAPSRPVRSAISKGEASASAPRSSLESTRSLEAFMREVQDWVPVIADANTTQVAAAPAPAPAPTSVKLGSATTQRQAWKF